MPPIYKINLRRNIGIKPDARNVYYLTDGTVTELRFFDELFNSTNFISNSDVRLIKCEKTGDDEGVSNGVGLIKLAKKYIESSPTFAKGYDKVLVVFDLDVYINSLETIIDYIKTEKDIIFAYSNPSFELFLLMCLDADFINKLLVEDKKRILDNQFAGTDRYIYRFIKKQYCFDSKDRNANFRMVANNVANSLSQDINITIDNAKRELTCNIPYVLSVINNNQFDSISYFKSEKNNK